MKKGIAALSLSFTLSSLSLAADAPANIVIDGQKAPFVYIVSATPTKIKYKAKRQAVAKDLDRSRIKSIVFSEPKSFSQAMESYLAGDLEQALTDFQQVSEDFKAVSAVKGNYSSLADFYVVECFRQLNQLDKLKKAVVDLRVANYSNPYHIKQIKLYEAWEAAEAKAWGRIITLAGGFNLTEYNPEQQAQIAYLSGLAYENQKKVDEALESYNKVLSVDMFNNQVLAQKSMLRAIGLLAQDDRVKKAKADIDAGKDAAGVGLRLINQAAALVNMYQSVLKEPATLPEDLAAFGKYTAKFD